MYIPKSVKTIGHHAFWDTVYKQDGEVKGLSVMNVELSEDEFKNGTELGDQWLPKYDYKLLKKTIDVKYSKSRIK